MQYKPFVCHIREKYLMTYQASITLQLARTGNKRLARHEVFSF